jgi:hypothetical protein
VIAPRRAWLTYLHAGRLVWGAMAALVAAASWYGLYRGDPDVDGLDITQYVHLDDPAKRGWTQGRDYVPGFLVARVAAPDGVELDDVYYAEARVREDGTQYDIRRVSNITQTPQAAEVLLAHTGSTALFAVDVFGQQQALLLVNFGGDERDMSAVATRADHARLEITNLMNTGRPGGVGQRLYGLKTPAKRLSATVGAGKYIVETPQGAVSIDATTGAVDAPELLTYQPRYFAQKQLVPWLVDTIRGLSWVGPHKVVLLEKFVFGHRDRLKRAAFAMGLVDESANLRQELDQEPGEALEFEVGDDVSSTEWPPKTVKSAFAQTEPGEGEWTPTGTKWLRRISKAPPAFYKTAVRMDPKRPYEALVLIAMDMRQLDMGLVAGTVNPRPSFGTPGTGIIPRKPELMDNLVAGFNGGFQTAHGAYGMVVNRQTILPAMPHAATVAVRDDGHVKMGTWYNSMTVPDDIHSLRQNLPPLMADGVFNPTNKRSRWGGTSSDLDLLNTTRSGMALCGDHTLMYAWCKSCSANAIGLGFISAGCKYGMHMDMNPTHTGWSWYRVDPENIGKDGTIKGARSAKGAKRMDFRVDRYIERDVKDFFYLTLRRDFTTKLAAPPKGFKPWGTEHAPTGTEGFLPVAATTTDDHDTMLVAMDATRLEVAFRRGDDEPDPTGTLRPADPVRLKHGVAALDLGLTTNAGLVVDGRIHAPAVAGQPAIVPDKDGLRILPALPAVNPRTFRGGWPLVKDGAPNLFPIAGPQGMRWGAIARVGDTFLYIQGTDPARMANALIELDVKTAVVTQLIGRKSPLVFLRGGEEVTPVDGEQSVFDATRAKTTHLYFEVIPAGPRTSPLGLEPVELSAEEQLRQKRLQGQINAMRQELRNVQNARYRAWKNKTGKP